MRYFLQTMSVHMQSASSRNSRSNWLALDSKMSKILMFVGILLLIGNAFSFYNKSYDGHTFILPEPSADYWESKPMKLSFSDAQSWCLKNVAGSKLATIPNINVQQDITDFIESSWQNKNLGRSGNDNIRLNGKFHFNTEWRWVNGRPKNAELTVREPNGNSNFFYARLDGKNYSIYSDNEKSHCFAICEYQGNSTHCDLFLNGRCYQKDRHRTWLNWHDAGYICSNGGGILASLETLSDTNINVSLKNLSLESNTVYCLGLQKNEWRWGDTGLTIKYTNWPFSRRFNLNLQCLCLTRLKYQWTECGCDIPYPFICMLNDRSMPDSSTQATQGTSTSSETIQFVILAVSCAVIFVVIIIIVVALIIKKRRNSDPQRALRSSGYVTPKHAVTESSTDFPVYEEIIQNPKEASITASDTTYASVVRKTVEKTEGEEHPVNSIVYAELDLTSKE